MPDHQSRLPVDERFLRRALALAALGTGTAAPNPRVGAVVARGARVLGQGFHLRPGEPHAEAVALRRVERSGARARGATLYTTLEPCCHTGRTPPCVEQILRAGVARVVAAMKDPDPRVDGGGFRVLRRAGVTVDVGLLAGEARRLNRSFVKHARTGLPLVTLKGAMTVDGRIATGTGSSKWITSALVRRHARLLRAEHEALLVGIGTVLADDPRLDRRPRARAGESAPLLRVVLDSDLRLSPESRLVRGAARDPVLVFCSGGVSPDKRRRLEAAGVTVESIPSRGVGLDLEHVLSRIGARGVTSVLVEGGSEVHGSFVDGRLADRLVLYIAPRIAGGRNARALVGGNGARSIAAALALREARCTRVAEAWLIEGSLG